MSKINTKTIALCIRILCAALVIRVAAPIPLEAQTQRQNNPTVRETLRWMQTTLENGGGDYEVGHEVRSTRLEDFSGCGVHFTYSTHQEPFANGEPAPDKKPTHIDYFFRLGDIDPTNIPFRRGERFDTPSLVTIRTRNDEKKITIRFPWESETDSKPDNTFLIFTLDSIDADYVSRFAKAFKHAVEACGGKPSFFTNSDEQDSDKHASHPTGGVAAQPAQRIDLSAGLVPKDPAARPAPPRKDIPAIAKAANGAVVSIIMSDEDGHVIAKGTGFVVSRDGRIVTNYHVIENGSAAVLRLPDGAFFVVDGVLAFDKTRDVAVIKAHGENFRTLALGNSDQLQVGEDVVAIGNPLSLESTVSNGIVSGIRTAEKLGGKFLQVTAPISPGSSGGPLFNMMGEVVGITTLYLKGGENLNFAIPINDAKRLLLNQSANLQSLPNEVVREETPKETHNAPSTPPREIPRGSIPSAPVATSITKIAASSPDMSQATPKQLWSDVQYCYQNPADNLQFSTRVVSCREINAEMERYETDCKSMGKKAPDGKYCKSFLKAYKLMEEGRLSIP